jgi:hypothetical protein
MAAAGGEVAEPTHERMRDMLRVRVEVDGGSCVLSCVDDVDEGRGQGD